MKNKFSKHNDPHVEREKQKYPHPIPSREYILDYLNELGRPASAKRIIKAFELDSEEEEAAVGFRLKAMARDGQLMLDRRGRYCILERLNLIRGRVVGHPDGFCLVHPDDDSGSLIIPAKQMAGAMDGDVVLACKTGEDRRGRFLGFIHEVVQRHNTKIVGRLVSQHGIFFVEPDNKKLSLEIAIPPDATLGATNGQIVLVEIIEYPSKRTQAIGQVIKILGEHMAPGMEIEVAILAHGLPNIWPEAVALETSQFKQVEPAQEHYQDRTDLRQLPFVTIDGEDAQDFDDAVYCEQLANNKIRLFVAIADVSHYVKPNSALDAEGFNRGNSVYFPGRVIPMLPEVLSNGLCSLKPQVDRLCMVCEMVIAADGSLTRYHFYRAVIYSHARLTYTQVAAILQNQATTQSHPLASHLYQLYDLYKILKTAREHRGALDFDTTETRIIFDENKKIENILPVVRNEAHRLIEECMLIANVATAKFLQQHKIPGLYRIHANPSDEKINNLREFLAELGINLPGGQHPKTKDFQATLTNLTDRPDRHLIETVMLRSLIQAEYSEKNIGHFGLGYTAYTHFTSPIRRYPDLLVHRAIAHILDHKQISEFEYSEHQMQTIGKHCSVTERRADDATRQVVSWLKCEYLQDKLGEEYQGTITNVTGFGIFVELNDIYVEGLVHVTGLKNDYYQFDAVKHRLIGERTRKIYRLGDSVNVRVIRVDLDERKIDFELI